MTATRAITRVEFDGPAGALEGLLHVPAGAPRLLAVVAHPHPLFGGTMDNKVTYRVACALEGAPGIVLRFNFRGVRGSAGAHDRGRGEQDDLRAAMARVSAEAALLVADANSLPIVLAGFSFGSVVSSRVACAGQPGVSGLLLVGAPVLSHGFEELASRPARLRVACVQGGRDEHGPEERLRAIWETVGGAGRLVLIPTAGHFFDDEQRELGEAVSSLTEFLAPLAPVS